MNERLLVRRWAMNITFACVSHRFRLSRSNKNKDASLIVLFITCCVRRLMQWSAFFFFRNPSVAVKGRLFCSWMKRKNGEGGGGDCWEALTTSSPLRFWRVRSPWQLFFEAIRWVRKWAEASQRVDTNRTQACAQTDDAPKPRCDEDEW